MSNDSTMWGRAKEIVGEALELAPADRRAFVESKCFSDHALRNEVRSLLAAAETSDALLHPDADAWVGATRAHMRVPAGTRLGKFEIRRVIAEGPGAAVYEAHQSDPDRRVALKVLRSLPMLGPDPRFRLEAAAAARVEHPNVVRVYEVGIVDGSHGQRIPFIAMELVEGVPITAHVQARALRVWEIVALIRKVALGVARIHQCGVIHRDLKPSNVLVDGGGEPRVLDFGIARLVTGADDTWRTHDGAMLGTPGYISPEQVQNSSAVDVRADIWAMGVMTYELLTGANPLGADGCSPLESFRRVVEQEPISLRRVAPNIPADLEAVVMKALARRPEDRYESALEFAADLKNATDRLPVRARRSTAFYRLGTFARRRAVPLAIVGVVGAAILTLTAGQVLAWRDAARERERARAALDVMRRMVSSANPNFGHRDALMRDVLLGVERGLDRDGGPDPLLQAEIASLLGTMTFGLGEYERSLALLQKALRWREEAGEGDSPEAMLDLAAIAQALRWLYRPTEALALAERARDESAARFGADHEAVLVAREAVAGCWHDLQRFEDAEREYRAIVADRARLYGPNARETLMARGALASLLSDMARYADAEAELTDLARRWDQHAGSLEPLTLRNNLARAVAEQGRLDEAVSLLRDLESAARASLGPTHPTTISIRHNLIEFVRRRGNEEEAMALAAELVAHCRESLGWAHDLTLNAATGYITALVRAGRGEEASTLATAAREACERALSPTDSWLPRLDAILAGALGASGKHDECLSLYEESIERLRGTLGPTHRQTLVARNNHGVALIEAARAAEAVDRLGDVLELVRSAGYVEMESTVGRNLGRALLAAGACAPGLDALRAAFEQSVARQELHNASMCARLIAEHHEVHGDSEAAARWRRKEAEPAAGD